MKAIQHTCKASMSLAVTALLAMCVTTAKADIKSTIQSATSGTTVTCSGTYTVSGKITVPSGVTVKGTATFKFSDSTSDGFYVGSGSSGVTFQSITVTGANHGFMIYGKNCKVVSCIATGNYNSGIEFVGTAASGNSASGCTSYNNADSSGGNADGFAVKNGTGANSFSSCKAYQNSDDGWDLYGANGKITHSSCTAYSNGKSASGKTGNGDGFKMGGTYNVAHSYTSCTAYSNTAGSTARGFDTNHNTAKITLTSCHSYSNGSKDVLGNSVLSNCTMQQ